MNKKLLIVLSLVILAAASAGVWWMMRPRSSPAAQPRPTSTTSTSQPTADTPAPTQGELAPGVRVTIGTHDTTVPSDTWVLVSKTRPLADTSYAPDVALAPVTSRSDKSTEERSLRRDIFPSVEALFKAASAQGHNLMIASGYRSAALQKMYFDNYAARSGAEAANRYSARPRQSEHQTGIAFDVSLTSSQCYLDTCLGQLPAGKWLAAHAHEYGFIVRYPEGKESITGYQYEPWHLRYVGPELATAIVKSGLTLDEAVAKIDAVKR